MQDLNVVTQEPVFLRLVVELPIQTLATKTCEAIIQIVATENCEASIQTVAT